MPGFNGSGIFTRRYSWVNDKANGIDITASRFDQDGTDVATGLSTCITKDGQQTTTARIPFAAGVSVNVGSKSSPSIGITGDSTTGFFQATSGSVSFAALGNQVLDLTSSGITLYGSSSGTIAFGAQAIAGTGTIFKLPPTTGTNGQLLQTDGSGNATWVNVTSGSGTVNSGTSGQIPYYASSTNAVSGNANLNISSGAFTIGVSGSQAGTLLLAGGSSGAVTLAGPASGGGTMTFQAGSDTVVGRATTDTLTNKTLTAAVLGSSTATTQSPLDNSTKVATTAYADAAVAAAGTGLSLLATVNSSAAASAVFTSGITSTYNMYMLTFDSVYMSGGGGHFGIEVSTNGGSSYITTASYFSGTNTGASDIRLATNPSTTSTQGMTGTIYFSKPSASAICSFFSTGYNAGDAVGSPTLINGTGANSTTSAINAIRLRDVTGSNNITGNFHLYGIKGT